MSGKPMDPERLAELRSRIEPCANGTAIRFPIFGWGELSEVLAHADHWEAEAERLESIRSLVSGMYLAECERSKSHLDTLAAARERAKSAEAEVERLGAEVVHLERELRIRVAKLAATPGEAT